MGGQSGQGGREPLPSCGDYPATRLHCRGCQESAGGGREEGVEVRVGEGWHRSAAVSVQ